MRPRPPSREPKSGPPLGRLRATPYRFRHTLQRVGSGTGSHHGRASSRCRPAALRYRDPRPIKIRAPAHGNRYWQAACPSKDTLMMVDVVAGAWVPDKPKSEPIVKSTPIVNLDSGNGIVYHFIDGPAWKVT